MEKKGRNEKMLKREIKWFVMLLLVFGFAFNGFQGHPQAAGMSASISVEGNQQTGTILPSTSVSLDTDETAFDILVHAIGENQIDYSNGTFGKMIKGINGLEASGTNFWGFYINGISAQVGADQYKVQDGDNLSFRYVDWTKAPEKSASIKVIGNQNQNILTNLSNVEFLGEPTAFQLLQVAVGTDKMVYSNSNYGKLITSIDGLPAEGNHYWAFYVNGKMADVGADNYQLKPGDQISFQYETFQNNSAPTSGNSNPTNSTFSKVSLQNSVNSASQYVLKNQIGDWEAISLKQAGKELPPVYLESMKNLIKNNNGHFSKITDTERTVLGILAAGGNPTNIEGYNLVESIYNGNVTRQGLNGVAYALIALDSGNFSVPNTAQWTREKLLNYLIDKQNHDGGWTWDGSSTSDLDTTAMVLTALAPYKDQQEVRAKVNSAVQYIENQYQASKIDNSSTAAQIVIALSSLGIDANGPLFTKEKNSLINDLMSYQNTTGGFKWKMGDQVDSFSTAQGFQAIVAYQLYLNKKGSLYQFVFHATPKVTAHTDTQKGHPLPNTATNAMNLLALGSFLLLVGIALIMRKKIKSV